MDLFMLSPIAPHTKDIGNLGRKIEQRLQGAVSPALPSKAYQYS